MFFSPLFDSTNVLRPSMFGAVGDDEADDGAALQAAIDMADRLHAALYLDKKYKVGQTITLKRQAQYYSSRRSMISSYSGYADGPVLEGGNWQSEQFLPYISGFSNYGLKSAGAHVGRFYIPIIDNCGDALVLDTVNATHPTQLDSTFIVQQIGIVERAVVLKADNAANVIQGNEILVNFAVNFTEAVLDFDGPATSPNWDSNKIVLQAVDALTSNTDAIVFRNAESYPVSRWIARVETWCGGLASSAKLISGKFNNLDAYMNLAQTPVDGWIEVEGTGNTINLRSRAGNTTVAVEVMTSPNSKGSFNGGASLYRQKFPLKATLASNLSAGATRTFYFYHQCADGVSNPFILVPGNTAGTGGGVIVDRCWDNSATNDDEVAFTIRNVSGATINSGARLDFTMIQLT